MQFSFTPYTFRRPFGPASTAAPPSSQPPTPKSSVFDVFALYTMDADPWADAPSSPQKASPVDISEASQTLNDSGDGVPPSSGVSGSPVKSAGFPSPTEPLGSPSKLAMENDDEGDIGMSAPRSPSPIKSTAASPVETPVTTRQEADKPEDKAQAEPESPIVGPDPYASTPAPLSFNAEDDADLFDDASFAVEGGASLGFSAEVGDDTFKTPEPLASPPALSPPDLSRPSEGDDFGDDGFGDVAFDDDGFNAPPPEGDDGFGDFDDFEAPAASFDDEDGFGDFGEFGETAGEEVKEVPPPMPVIEWSALSVRPVPPLGELQQRITAVLEPLIPDNTNFTDEAPRAVGGLSQVLATESCRDTFAQLTTAPMLKPLDWTRSRVRRDHLISMGVPVNLDEVDSHRLSTLPPLQITTAFSRSQSVGPERLSRSEPAPAAAPDRGPASAGPALGGAETERKYGLGARPPLDMARAEELCGLDEDQLSLLPLSKLEALHADLARHTAEASSLLAWFLQLKDAQTQDAATYNGMISELIANAAKVKGGSTGGGGGLFRRNSGRPASMSSTPRRSGSPGVF